jgi:hypothetical protein
MNIRTAYLIPFISGLVLAILGAILMFIGILPISARITIGIVGIILISTAPQIAEKIKK